MNKLLLYAFLVFTAISACGQKGTYRVGVIGFYNLENLFDTINDPKINDEEFLPGGTKNYTGEVYLDKLGNLEEVLSQVATDQTPDGLSLFGCAEVENKAVLEDLVKQPLLAGRNYKVIHVDSPDERGIDVGLVYNPKYFTPTSHEALFVPVFNADSSPRKTRDILFVSGMYDGEPLHIMVGHWPSRRGGEEASAPGRASAARVCRNKIDSLTKINPDAKIIVMGDLNDDPTSPSVYKVIGAKGDQKKVDRGGMFNPWMKPYRQGVGTLAYNDSWNLFDQIIISSGFLDKEKDGYFFHSAHIFSRPWMLQTSGRYKGYPKRTYDFDRYMSGYSDHFPTFIVLRKKVE